MKIKKTTAPKNQTMKSPFQNISPYVSKLKALALEDSKTDDWAARCQHALNGRANIELRDTIDIDVRRQFGVFFTSAELAEKLLTLSKTEKKRYFYDPTCGMGDLLLAAAAHLPLGVTVAKTLRSWGRQLAGTDLHKEFIDAAKIRLALLARQRHDSSNSSFKKDVDYFPNIRVGNGLEEISQFAKANCILLNPPFGSVVAPPDCEWASGRITEAASFTMSIAEKVSPGTEILAILPDVLRSGSFSFHWRNTLSKLTEVHEVQSHGIFDQIADVDVFLLRLIKRSRVSALDTWSWPAQPRSASTIADQFTVNVGPVVPHRDKKEGDLYDYIHARSVPAWGTMTDFSEKIRFKGRVHLPPFVVIRRTSRPEQEHRAVATLIKGTAPIAVENHLIICTPQDGTIASCERLIKKLRKESTNKYLNTRIRCRHLTVTSVRDIPFEESK